MAFDGMMVYAITNELKEQLQQGRITKIYQPYARDIVLHIRANRANVKLLLSANPTYPRIHFIHESPLNPHEAPLFCMVLRKHLEGGIIESINQVGAERIIHIDVKSKNELGDIHSKRLVFELMGKHSNLILTDPNANQIMDSIHHVSPAINQYRTVLPGKAYVDPPAQNKLNPLTTDAATFASKINFNAGKIERQIVDQFSGVSPLLAKEIVHRAGLGGRDIYAASFLKVISLIKDKHFAPTIMTTNAKAYFYLFPLQHIQGTHTSFANVSTMIEHFYKHKAATDRLKQKAADLIRLLLNEIKKNERKIKKLEQTVQESKQADQYQLYGELLTAYMHQVSRGDKEAVVINYYDPDGGTVSIPLDPKKTPNENAQHFFKKYAKLKKAGVQAEHQIHLATTEIAYLDTLLHQLDHAGPTEIEEIREELIEGKYLRNRSPHKRNKNKHRPQLPEFESSEGITIVVGKNNKQNDYLTNKLAHATHTWLHTKDIPGSHVVIQAQNFGEQTLQEAAIIAAYFSKAKNSSQVPVDYTLVKHVRKPNGAKPGFVIYDQQQTIFVTPQVDTVKRLAKKN